MDCAPPLDRACLDDFLSWFHEFINCKPANHAGFGTISAFLTIKIRCRWECATRETLVNRPLGMGDFQDLGYSDTVRFSADCHDRRII